MCIRDRDLTAYYYTVQGKRNSINAFQRVSAIEKEMFRLIFPHEKVSKKDIYLKEINEGINEQGIDCNIVVIKEILNYWSQVNYIRKERIDRPNNQFRIRLNNSYARFKDSLENRLKISVHCLSILEQNYLPLAKEEAIFPVSYTHLTLPTKA